MCGCLFSSSWATFRGQFFEPQLERLFSPLPISNPASPHLTTSNLPSFVQSSARRRILVFFFLLFSFDVLGNTKTATPEPRLLSRDEARLFFFDDKGTFVLADDKFAHPRSRTRTIERDTQTKWRPQGHGRSWRQLPGQLCVLAPPFPLPKMRAVCADRIAGDLRRQGRRIATETSLGLMGFGEC